MPRLMETTRERRRQTLIDAGWACLDRTGYRALTVDQVCQEARVSKGAFYGYFAHKQQLLLALLRDDAAQVEATMLSLEAASQGSHNRLRGFADAMLKRAQAPGRVQLAADLWSSVSTDPELTELLVSVTAGRRSVLRGWIEEGAAAGEIVRAPANALASVLLALSEGLSLHAGLDPKAFRWQNVQLTLDLLLSGLQAR